MKRVLSVLVCLLFLTGCVTTRTEIVSLYEKALVSCSFTDWKAIYPPAFLKNVEQKEYDGSEAAYQEYLEPKLENAKSAMQEKYGTDYRINCSYTTETCNDDELNSLRDLLMVYGISRSSLTEAKTLSLSLTFKTANSETTAEEKITIIRVKGGWFVSPGSSSFLP